MDEAGELERVAARAGGDDHGVAAMGAGGGEDFGDVAVARGKTLDRRVLVDASAEILQRPGIGLHGALRVRVTAEMEVLRAERVVADQRRVAAERRGVELLRAVLRAHGRGQRGDAAVALLVELRKIHDDAFAAVFGGIAEQLVHLRPEALLLAEQRALVMGAAAAVAARRLPAHDAALEHGDVVAGAGEPPGGGQAGDAAADHRDRGAPTVRVRTAHVWIRPVVERSRRSSSSVPIAS